MKEFPENPHEREIVVTIDEDFKYRLKYDPKLKFIIPSEEKQVFVCNVDKTSLPPAIKSAFKPMNVYIRSPFDDLHYFTWKEAIYQIPRIKYEYFLTFCGLLGATSAKIEEVIDERTNRKWRAEGNIGPFVKGIVGRDFKEKLLSSLVIEKIWKKKSPDLSQAERFLLEKHLIGDYSFRNLLEEVKWNPHIEEYRIRIDITKEVNEKLSILVKLNIDSFDIDFDYIKELVTDYHFILETDVIF